MNKRGLVAVCAPRLGGRVAAEAAVEAIFDAIVRELVAGGHVVLTGFGTFEAVERRPRMGRNPFTGEPVAIPPRRVAVFRPAKMFRRFMVEPGLLPAGERPTLGFYVLDWIEENLAAPDRQEYEPFVPTREQAEFILRFYAGSFGSGPAPSD